MRISRVVRTFAVRVVKRRFSPQRFEYLRLALGRPPAPASEPASLTALARRHKTDKAGTHHYTEHYERFLTHLREKPFTFFEIGIGGYNREGRGGASLRMWRDFFPRGQIVGLDIEDKTFVAGDRIHPYQGSQVDSEVLDQIFADFTDVTVVLDDGSHQPEHVRETFKLLFDRLPDDGIYIIEDTQTSYWPGWGGNMDRHAENTTMSLVKDMVDGLNWEEYLEPHTPTSTDLNIRAIHCFHNLVIIEKGDNREGTNKRKVSRHDFGDAPT